jgi:hypothetical protein
MRLEWLNFDPDIGACIGTGIYTVNNRQQAGSFSEKLIGE